MSMLGGRHVEQDRREIVKADADVAVDLDAS